MNKKRKSDKKIHIIGSDFHREVSMHARAEHEGGTRRVGINYVLHAPLSRRDSDHCTQA